MADIDRALDAVAEVMRHGHEWAADYTYSNVTNEYRHRDGDVALRAQVSGWYASALA